MEDEMTQKALKALADPTRLRIVKFIAGMCCGMAAVDDEGGVYEAPTASEVCCHISGAEKITSTISHHLHELEGAGLVRIERSGKRMLCTLKPEAFEALADQIRLLPKGGNRNDCC
jgi:DNA-binding transcriptional ArsR family regulator